MHNLQKTIEQKIMWLQIVVKNAYNIINSIIICIITVQLLIITLKLCITKKFPIFSSIFSGKKIGIWLTGMPNSWCIWTLQNSHPHLFPNIAWVGGSGL